MTKEHLDHEPRLYTATYGRVTLISLEPIHFHKVAGVAVLIEAGATPAVEKLLRTKAGIDAAEALGLSEKKISRLKKGLGIPLQPREGDSKTTLWRRGKEAEGESKQKYT